jgi:hypothetical protein
MNNRAIPVSSTKPKMGVPLAQPRYLLNELNQNLKIMYGENVMRLLGASWLGHNPNFSDTTPIQFFYHHFPKSVIFVG